MHEKFVLLSWQKCGDCVVRMQSPEVFNVVGSF